MSTQELFRLIEIQFSKKKTIKFENQNKVSLQQNNKNQNKSDGFNNGIKT